MGKIGRNEKCPCNSGKKYKRCCGRLSNYTPEVPMDDIKLFSQRMEALQKQREQQQGLGRNIISTMFQGYRVVAVGNRIYYSTKWKTFHDFLMDYIKMAMDGNWGNEELAKPEAERHPILIWYKKMCDYQKSVLEIPGKVSEATMNGATAAYISLAYNLYLLAHNVELQSLLLHRLKNKDQFWGAYYETFVAASFIKAGFDIEMEDETDGTRSHCEFTATHRETGKKFSVEAKRIERVDSYPDYLGIGNPLYAALKKQADHERIIFIDFNDRQEFVGQEKWVEDLKSRLKEKETMTISGNLTEPAYVYVTNYPYDLHLDELGVNRTFVVLGYKRDDFNMFFNKRLQLRDAINIRDTHQEIFHLSKTMIDFYTIPPTFDGEIPELAFGRGRDRLLIGNKYLVPFDDGLQIGKLDTAIVISENKHAVCGLSLENGTSALYTMDMTEDELKAYEKNPDTFFGVYNPNKKCKDALDLYDFFLESYQNSTKENLLKFMKTHPDYEKLQSLPQEDLAKIYCERMASIAASRNQ